MNTYADAAAPEKAKEWDPELFFAGSAALGGFLVSWTVGLGVKSSAMVGLAGGAAFWLWYYFMKKDKKEEEKK